jgi:DNA-binding NarL/FixJ family response regulator
MIRVALVDDHPIVLDGIALNLDDADDVEVVARAATGEEALATAARLHPDVVVLDLELPDRSGLEVLQALKSAHLATRVVIFTAYGGRERIAAALENGADSYVLKGTSSSELLEAIRAVSRGEHYLPRDIASELVGALRTPSRDRLTAREREILKLLAAGLANKEIATQLAISERTVKFHVSEILARLEASNRAHAVAMAQELGLL